MKTASNCPSSPAEAILRRCSAPSVKFVINPTGPCARAAAIASRAPAIAAARAIRSPA